jgi:hypothetical protein
MASINRHKFTIGPDGGKKICFLRKSKFVWSQNQYEWSLTKFHLFSYKICCVDQNSKMADITRQILYRNLFEKYLLKYMCMLIWNHWTISKQSWLEFTLNGPLQNVFLCW